MSGVRIGYVVPGFPADEEDWFTPAVADTIERVAKDQEVRVFSLRYPGTPAPYRWHGVPVTPAGASGMEGIWRGTQRVVEAHRRQPFDLLHAFWATDAGLVGALSSWRCGVPLVVTCAGGELAALNDIAYGDWRTWQSRVRIRRVLGRASAIIAGSACQESLVRARHERWSRKTVRIPLGIDTQRFRPDADETKTSPPTLISVAGLVPVKNHRLLFDALAWLKDRPWRLEMVGDGPLKAALQAQAQQLGLADRIRWHGWVPHRDIGRYYRQADLFVLTSDHEAQSVALLEAMACGLPVAATEVGLTPEIVSHADNGVCVPCRDAKALAAAIASMLDTPERRRCAGRNSLGVSAAYDHRALIPGLIEVYERVINSC